MSATFHAGGEPGPQGYFTACAFGSIISIMRIEGSGPDRRRPAELSTRCRVAEKGAQAIEKIESRAKLYTPPGGGSTIAAGEWSEWRKSNSVVLF